MKAVVVPIDHWEGPTLEMTGEGSATVTVRAFVLRGWLSFGDTARKNNCVVPAVAFAGVSIVAMPISTQTKNANIGRVARIVLASESYG